MRSIALFGVVVSSLICTVAMAAPVSINLDSNSASKFKLELRLNADGLDFTTEEHNGVTFTKFSIEGRNFDYVGQPDTPRIYRYLAVDPDKKYNITADASEPIVFRDVVLMPVQPEVIEGERVNFYIDDNAYSLNRTYGEELAVLGDVAKLGRATVLPVMFSPYHYNPATRILTVWRSIKVTVSSNDRDEDNYFAAGVSLSSFQRTQFKNLILNKDQILSRKEVENDVTLIITTEELLDNAMRISSIYRDENRSFLHETISSSMSSSSIKNLIKAKYEETNLDSVVLFGDENHVKLYYWSSSMPGDSGYSMVDGSDKLIDIGLGRIPVSNNEEAEFFLSKLEKFNQQQQGGHISKNIMLLAHKENYPGKYTANQMRIVAADNPREFNYVTQYGGAGAKNSTVQQHVTETDFAIINYRGHGSSTAWTGWGRDGGSFSTSQINALENYDTGMAVFFNIACTNGAVQNSSHSMAENILFAKKEESEFFGGVAVVAATKPSYTTTNHDFDENLFMYLQTEENISVGNIFALANNKLTLDNGGSMPTNVKMYILFGDPLLKPSLF